MLLKDIQLMQSNKHCHYCGTEYVDKNDPYFCHNCKNTVWINPIPVVIVAIPLIPGEEYLGIVRGDPNEAGYEKNAFVSGFLDKNEDWEIAGIREIREETGINIKSLTLKKLVTRNNMLFILAISDPVEYNEVDWNFSNNETKKIIRLNKESDLAFPIQQELLNSFYL